MLPVSVVTGFLGSGKTTLIRRLLRDPAMARTAVIVNEFGEIGLDQDLISPGLQQSGDETVLALTTGCLCCAIRTDLATTLLDLLARRTAGAIAYDRVLVETSGLADPAPILHALMTDPALAGTHAIGAVVTVVDSLLGADTLARHPEARRQLALADRILLSKTDLTAPSPALRAAIAALNPQAPEAEAAPALLLAPAPGPRTLAEPTAHHGGDIESFHLERATPLPALALTLWLQALAEHCGERLLRMKGLVDVLEMPGRPAVIHGVQHVFAEPDWLEAWPAGPPRTRVVFIARLVDGRAIPRHFPARLLDAIATEVAEETGITAG